MVNTFRQAAWSDRVILAGARVLRVHVGQQSEITTICRSVTHLIWSRYSSFKMLPEAWLKALEPADYLRTGAMLVGFVTIGCFGDQDAWVEADVVASLIFGLANLFFPKLMLEFQVSSYMCMYKYTCIFDFTQGRFPSWLGI